MSWREINQSTKTKQKVFIRKFRINIPKHVIVKAIILINLFTRESNRTHPETS